MRTNKSDAANRQPEPMDVHVGKRIREFRKLLKVTASEVVAELARDGQPISVTQYLNYERGLNRISAAKLHRIATIFDCPIQYFFDTNDTIPASLNFVGRCPDLDRLKQAGYQIAQ